METTDQIFSAQSGLLFTVNLTVKEGAAAGTYGISLDTVDGMVFTGKNAVYTSTYSVGLEETEWDLSTWEGTSYPNTYASDWDEYYGSLGGSDDPNITLVASYIEVTE